MLLNPVFNVATGIVNSFAGKEVIFLIAGQSNSIGRFGPIDGVLDATDTDILMYKPSTDTLVTAADPLDHAGQETANTVGPGLSFAKRFKADYSPSKVILVGAGLGGSGFLNSDWVETAVGNQYDAVLDRWQAAWSRVQAVYPGAIAGGFIWLQGEDEVIDYYFEFTSGNGYEHNPMPMNLFRVMRAEFDGFDDDTCMVVCGLPPGTALTARAVAYAAVQDGLSDIPALLHRSGYADYTGLTVADDRHFDAASCRIMGDRAADAFSDAISSTTTRPPEPTFTPDPANVSTIFSFDVSTTPDFKPLRPNAGVKTIFENRRAWVEDGALQFDGGSELRFGERVGNVYLTDKDFSFKLRWRGSVGGVDGLFGHWTISGSQRSFLLRVNTSKLQFYGSNNGSTSTLMLEVNVSNNTWYETEVRRVGTALSLIQNGTTVDTYTLSSGSTFYTPSNAALKFLIGDYENSNNFDGEMSRFSLEFLS